MQDRIKVLEALIMGARAAYYNETPQVSDEQFDAWVDELRALSPRSEAITSIGAPVANSPWEKARHGFVMGSLDKVNTPEEFGAWAASTGTHDRLFLVTEKLDGISLHCKYEYGKLVQAITRGDGTTGEDITRNVLRMKGVPKEIPAFTGSLRGEIVLLKSAHNAYFPDYANPRNAASGIAKRHDGKGCEHLTVMFYQVVDGPFGTELEQFEWLEERGLRVPTWIVGAPVAEWLRYQESVRDNLDYDIDGLVIRINDLTVQASLGDKDGRPRGAIAFKFPASSKETTLRAIEWQVGGTGRITPVAVFDAVNLLGAKVTNASLYNVRNIRNLGVSVGSRILVSRANDVIPTVMSVTEPSGEPLVVPAQCPCCGTPTEQEGEYLVCPNQETCPAQAEGRIKRYIVALDVKEWGDVLIERLVQSKKVVTPVDLYRLTPAVLASLDRITPTLGAKLLDLLWAKNDLSIETLLGALSIPLCQSSTIQMVTDAGHETWEAIQGLSRQDIQAIPGLGPVKAAALFDWIHGPGKLLVADLLGVGVRIKARQKGRFTGHSFCFTGSMTRKRSDLEALVVDQGGTVKSSVGKGLTYLVMADPNSTSSKAQAARKNGTRCISEEDFIGMTS